MGQKIGVLGKEGSSGGWSHLHFDIKGRQPSGKWGIQEGYAFLWEAYRREHRPQIIAVARPHHLIWAGEKVGPRRLALLERGGQDRALRVDLHRRDRRDRTARGTHLRASRGNTARS